ncbi:MAG: hydantoinase/oxoprolinase family protein [Solibacillus sp.]
MGLLMTIDNGGTFTDACVIAHDRIVSRKALTTPHDLTKCFVDVIKEVSKELYGKEDMRKLLTEIEYLRYSTTAGTNAIVQKRGPRLGLLLRAGADPFMLQDNAEQKEMFDILVGDRVSFLETNEDDRELDAKVVEAVNQLLALGANRIVLSLNNPNLVEDEKKIKQILLRKYPRHLLGAVPILISHELTDDTDDARRTWGALINSFLHTGMERFLFNAENVLREHRMKNPMLIFQNDGNSARIAKTTAIKSYGSGPRGGMEGTKALAKHYNIEHMLTLDVGGTTSDIGLVKNGEITEEKYGRVESIPTSFSQSDLTSIGAGGSSIMKVVDGQIQVGPESVGAAPGPACFARGGVEATITDAYLLMGILDSNSYFGGSMKLDEARAKSAIEEKIAKPLDVSLEEALVLMEKAYEQKIADGLKDYQQQVDDVTLLAFGGAGPMSACGIAEAATIQKIVIPRLAAVFSAFGISFSDIAHEYQVNLTDATTDMVKEKAEQLLLRAKRDMFAEGFDLSQCQIRTSVQLTRGGQEETILLDNSGHINLEESENVSVHLKVVKEIEHVALEKATALKAISPNAIGTKTILDRNKQWADVPVYHFEQMTPGTQGVGPAIIQDEYFTCRVLDGWAYEVNDNQDIFLTK